MAGFFAWFIGTVSVLLNVVFLLPRKWKLWIWSVLPISHWFSSGAIVEQQLTPAQKRQRTLLLKKQKEAVKDEALTMLKYIHDTVGDNDRTINSEGLLHFIRKLFHKSSKQMREFLGVPEKQEEVLALPSPPPTPAHEPYRPQKEELDTEIIHPPQIPEKKEEKKKRPINFLPPKPPTLQEQLFAAIHKRGKVE